MSDPVDGQDELDAETVSGVRAGLRASSRWARVYIVYPPELSVDETNGVNSREVRGLRPLVLGRKPDSDDTPLRHKTVSRSHVKIEWTPRAHSYTAVDLGSRNGSWVDGTRLSGTPVQLRCGSVLRIGDVLAVFETGSTEPQDDPRVRRDAIVGDAPAAVELRGQVGRAAADPSPVLIIGETGTGKELTAAELHRLSGRSGPQISFNCAELNTSVVESQLFGHEKGAFTGATTASPGLFRAADRGTLFLDEVGELPVSLQPKLLRVVQTGEVMPVGGTKPTQVDVRVVAATNRDLTKEVELGSFRRDLYARLAMWEIRMPPLSQRRSDLLRWVDILHRAWLKHRGRESAQLEFEPDVAESILRHPWPENLRGLDRLVHALASVEPRESIRLDALPPWFSPDPGGARPSASSSQSHEGSASTSSAAGRKPPAPNRDELLAALEQHDWVIRAVARHFDRDRRQIYRWLDQHGLRREQD